MNRRSLLGRLLAAPLAFMFPAPKAVYQSEWGIGEYVSHTLTTDIGWKPGENGDKKIYWPIEWKLEIFYSQGSEIYVTHNVRKDQVQAIMSMSPAELFATKTCDFEPKVSPHILHILGRKFYPTMVVGTKIGKSEL